MKKMNLFLFVWMALAGSAAYADEEATTTLSAEEQVFAEKLDETQRYHFRMLTPEQRKAEMIASADETAGDIESLQEVH